jgi:hypothetical protein
MDCAAVKRWQNHNGESIKMLRKCEAFGTTVVHAWLQKEAQSPDQGTEAAGLK